MYRIYGNIAHPKQRACAIFIHSLNIHQAAFFFKRLEFIYLFIYLFIYFWLCWVFVSVRGLSLVAAIGGHSSSRCAGLSLSRPLLLRSTGSRHAGSVVVAHGPSCSAACGIFPDQGSNPCALHWQADSQPLRHQGSPIRQPLCVRNRAKHWDHRKQNTVLTLREFQTKKKYVLWVKMFFLHGSKEHRSSGPTVPFQRRQLRPPNVK